MIRIQLTDTQRTELRALRQTNLPAVARDRLEMVFLSDAGWSAPRIAQHLGRNPHTVRSALKGFRQRSTAAFQPDKPGPEPDHQRRTLVTDLLRDLLAQDRTWTTAQLAEALRPSGIVLSGRQVRRSLHLLKAYYRRTAQTVRHMQDPQKVERARTVLAGLKKSRGGPAETLLPRRGRLLAVVADGLLVVVARPAEAGEVRVAAGAPGERPGDL